MKLTIFVIVLTMFIYSCGTEPNGEPSLQDGALSNPEPPDLSVVQNDTITLRWNSSYKGDSNPDFQIYFDTINPPKHIAAEGIKTTYYFIEGLIPGKTYYWKINLSLPGLSSVSGPIWRFSRAPKLNSPYIPVNPYPQNGALNLNPKLILAWDGGHPDGNIVNYELLFGTDPDELDLIYSGESTAFKFQHTLTNNTIYYWRVSVKDAFNKTAISPLWSFKTGTDTKSPDNFFWISVPPGAFLSGENSDFKTIDHSYDIMKYEVTNAQFVRFLSDALNESIIYLEGNEVKGFYAGDDRNPAGNYTLYRLNSIVDLYNIGYIDYTEAEFIVKPHYGYLNHPVVNVTWFGAQMFADFYGIRLPSEDEWEKAARGTLVQSFPWDGILSGDRVNFWLSGDPFDNGTSPVGLYNGANYIGFNTKDSPSPLGAYDMGGNVWEWTTEWYDDFLNYRVIRGGAWDSLINKFPKIWIKVSKEPLYSSLKVGFRCVR